MAGMIPHRGKGNPPNMPVERARAGGGGWPRRFGKEILMGLSSVLVQSTRYGALVGRWWPTLDPVVVRVLSRRLRGQPG